MLNSAANFRSAFQPSHFFGNTSRFDHSRRACLSSRRDLTLGNVTHPEPELAVIIGRGDKNISEEDALSHVFGYSIMDDITSPGLKEQDSIECIVPKAAASSKYTKLTTWRNVPDEDNARSLYLTYHARSKGTDTLGALGLWLVTSDDIANPNELSINSYSGDELALKTLRQTWCSR